jgi:large subunit ribosomal protein L31
LLKLLLAFVPTLCYSSNAVCGSISSADENDYRVTFDYREVNKMKEGIHPTYYQATVTCNCGNTFVTGSTKPEIHVEVCSKCHSFYTGQQKSARADGRIDKFNKKYGLQ